MLRRFPLPSCPLNPAVLGYVGSPGPQSLPEGEPAIEEMTGEPTGDPPAGEMTDGAVVTRLKVKYRGADSSVNKLVVFSAVASGGKLVVVYANCQWKDLPYWERRLMQIVGSLAPRTK